MSHENSLRAETVMTQPIVSESSRGVIRSFIELSKPRISTMVLFSVGVAAIVSITPGSTNPNMGSVWMIIHGMIGLLFVSASGCALNQYLERYTDWMMPRTAKRPLPDYRLSAVQVAVFGAVTFGVGVAWCWALVNWQTAALAAGSWVLYVLIYTPMKVRTWLNTYVGAVAGAMPILVGSTAAADGQVTWPALLLFGVLYLWQFPHFMAISWLYRSDYRQGGIKMASTVDDSGKLVGHHAIWFAVLMLPVTAASFWPNNNAVDWLFLVPVMALGLWYLQASISFFKDVNESTARRLFRVSLLHLTAYLVLLTAAAWIN